MKYMLLLTGTKADFDWFAKWSKDDLQAHFAFMHAFNKELKDSGVLIAAEGLAFPDQARIVRAGSDGAPITDGVFPESKEFLAGFWIIDVESPEQAYRIAARASAAPAPAGTKGLDFSFHQNVIRGARARGDQGEHARRGAASDERSTGRIAVTGQSLDIPIEHLLRESTPQVLGTVVLRFRYTSSAGPDLRRDDLSHEAIRLTRIVHHLQPSDTEVAGLLALMLLTDARRPARTSAKGEFIPLAQQDRSLWDKQQIAEGVALISATLPEGSVGPYQLQAAIAAVHDEAARADDTDWPQILALYDLLRRMTDNPVVRTTGGCPW